MNTNATFIDKMNRQNFGKKAIIITGLAILFSFVVKCYCVPILTPKYDEPFFKNLKFIISIIDNFILLNIICFFVALIGFKKTIGIQIVQTMQNYRPNKYIKLWLQSLLISFILLGITTFITHTLFKSWWQWIFLVLLATLPFILRSKLQQLKQKRNYY